jgi:hypothetical protein
MRYSSLFFLLAIGCTAEGTSEPPLKNDVPATTPAGTTPGTTTGAATGSTQTNTTPTATTLCDMPVPDPGMFASPSDWEAPPGAISPDVAYDVGTVVNAGDAPNYIGTTLPGIYEEAYWVFRAGSDFNLNLRVQNSDNPFEHMHLHEAPDLCFGDQILPINEDIGSWYIESVFPVEADMVYVLEVRVPGAGFF